MGAGLKKRRSGRNKSARWIVASIVVCSGMSCIAPVLYASTDCSRWLAEYKQGVMQRKAARRLRAAKIRLITLVHKPAPPHVLPARHRMGPLESLRRFQIDCGELEEPDTPLNTAVLPPAGPLLPEPTLAMVNFGEPVPDLPPPTYPLVAEATVPPLIDVPVIPVIGAPLPPVGPAVTPEPGTFLLVLTGAGAFVYFSRRRQVEDGSEQAKAL